MKHKKNLKSLIRISNVRLVWTCCCFYFLFFCGLLCWECALRMWAWKLLWLMGGELSEPACYSSLDTSRSLLLWCLVVLLSLEDFTKRCGHLNRTNNWLTCWAQSIKLNGATSSWWPVTMWGSPGLNFEENWPWSFYQWFGYMDWVNSWIRRSCWLPQM